MINFLFCGNRWKLFLRWFYRRPYSPHIPGVSCRRTPLFYWGIGYKTSCVWPVTWAGGRANRVACSAGGTSQRVYTVERCRCATDSGQASVTGVLASSMRRLVPNLSKMMRCWFVSAVALLLSVSHVTAYPSRLACSQDLTVGTSIMNSAAVSESNAGVEFR